MRRLIPEFPRQARLALAFLLYSLMVKGALSASLPANPAIRFLSAVEARSALTDGPEMAYFESLHLGEMRAKTGLPLKGISLDEARVKTRNHYAAEVLDFSDDEKAALEGILRRLYPLLKQKAPLYARTRWSLLKVSAQVEGGLPHTRGDHIVLSSGMLQAFATFHKLGRLNELDARAANLMVHELTHVIQRQRPALFAALNTEVLGFRRMDPAPVTPWLLERRVVNPDAPDSGWAFPITDGVDKRWIMPFLILSTTDTPRMPRDFMTVGVTVELANGRWTVSEQNGQARFEQLNAIQAYRQAFPNLMQSYHPNEISAEILAGWITGHESADPAHSVTVKTANWAATNLK